MLLLAIQSAFFGPAKYGMIPEIVRDEDLSQANGSINMATNIAVIAGTLASGPIYTLLHPASAGSAAPVAEAVPSAPGLALLLVAAIGLAASLFIPRLEAMNPGLKIDWNPFRPYVGAVREMARDARIGRAEAMRRSMLALIDKGAPEEAHPAYWAPFVVVGEGAAGR